MKRKMLYLLAILVFWLVLDQCTILNVRASNLLVREPIDSLPSLSQKIESKSYEIVPALSGSYGAVYYEPNKQYFVAQTSSGVVKIDHSGKVVFLMEQNEENPIMRDEEGTHFILTKKGIINLEEDQPMLHAYKVFDNLTDSSNAQAFTDTFSNYYSQANYVIFDRYFYLDTLNRDLEAIHFQIKNQWITIINNLEVGSISVSGTSKISYRHYDLGTFEGKYNPMAILKDVKKATYSNNNLETDRELQQFYVEDFPHKEFIYASLVRAKIKKFQKLQKEDYPETVWFLLPLSWLPEEFSGKAITEITVGNEKLKLKTDASRKAMGIVNPDNNLYFFEVPKEFQTAQTPIIVMNVSKSNQSVYNNQGFFVLCKKINGITL